MEPGTRRFQQVPIQFQHGLEPLCPRENTTYGILGPQVPAYAHVSKERTLSTKLADILADPAKAALVPPQAIPPLMALLADVPGNQTILKQADMQCPHRISLMSVPSS